MHFGGINVIAPALVPIEEQTSNEGKKARKLFSAEEDALLSKIMFERPFTTWIAVAAQMPGRSPRQCRDRWANYLCPGNKNGPWSHDEDRILAEKYRELGPQWTTIARFFDGRSENNVKNRWYTHLKSKYAGRNRDSGTKNTAPGKKQTEPVKEPGKTVRLPPISTFECEAPSIDRHGIIPQLMSCINKAKSGSAQPYTCYRGRNDVVNHLR